MDQQSDDAEDESGLSNMFEENQFSVKDNCTYYVRSRKGCKKRVVFMDAVLRIYADLYNFTTKKSNSWIVLCQAKDSTGSLITKKFNFSSESFASVQTFQKDLTNKFGRIIIVRSITKEELINFQVYLNQQYNNSNNKKVMYSVPHKGFMGDSYWFLSQELQLKNGRLLDEEDREFFQEKDDDMPLEINKCLLKYENCTEINKKIVENLECFDLNQKSVELLFGFVLSRLLQSTSPDLDETGETNMVLLYGEKNVGKSLAQTLVHFGQGASKEIHPLLKAGGNSISTGTSIKVLQDICSKTTLLVNIDDAVINSIQAESLLHIHGKLQQGSSRSGVWHAKTAGVIMSSNDQEPNRLEGRVIRFDFRKSAVDQEEKISNLKNICKQNTGFLLSWVMHFAAKWFQNVKSAKKSICSVLAENLPTQQQRWRIGISLALYSRYFYFSSLGLECSLEKEIKWVIEEAKKKEKRPFMERLENDILSKIAKKDCQVLEWLNWNDKIKLKTGKEKAVGIKAAIFSKFIDIDKSELEEFIKNVGAKKSAAIGVTLSYADSNENPEECTLKDLKTRSQKTSATRGHKIPLSRFRQDFQHWLIKENFNNDLPPLAKKTAHQVIFSSQSSASISEIEQQVSSCLQGLDSTSSPIEEKKVKKCTKQKQQNKLAEEKHLRSAMNYNRSKDNKSTNKKDSKRKGNALLKPKTKRSAKISSPGVTDKRRSKRLRKSC